MRRQPPIQSFPTFLCYEALSKRSELVVKKILNYGCTWWSWRSFPADMILRFYDPMVQGCIHSYVSTVSSFCVPNIFLVMTCFHNFLKCQSLQWLPYLHRSSRHRSRTPSHGTRTADHSICRPPSLGRCRLHSRTCPCRCTAAPRGRGTWALPRPGTGGMQQDCPKRSWGGQQRGEAVVKARGCGGNHPAVRTSPVLQSPVCNTTALFMVVNYYLPQITQFSSLSSEILLLCAGMLMLYCNCHVKLQQAHHFHYTYLVYMHIHIELDYLPWNILIWIIPKALKMTYTSKHLGTVTGIQNTKKQAYDWFYYNIFEKVILLQSSVCQIERIYAFIQTEPEVITDFHVKV